LGFLCLRKQAHDTVIKLNEIKKYAIITHPTTLPAIAYQTEQGKKAVTKVILNHEMIQSDEDPNPTIQL
jgi:hypothetical protein